jgi:Helicase HerA, central domain
MAQTKFDKQVEETAEAVAFGIGRFLTGREMDGVRRTDATFFRPGRRILPKVEGRVSPTSYWPIWQRIAVRLTSLSAAGGIGYSYWQDPAPTLQALEYGGAGAAVLAAAGALAYAIRGREQRELMREWVDPLHQALAQPLGIAEQTDPRRYLHVPKNFSDDTAVIRIDLPVSLRFNQDLVADLIAKKLALENISFTWRHAGREPHVLIKKAHRPPNKLRFTDPDVREILATMPESAPLIGLGAGKKKVAVDLDHDSPHVLVSAGTGGGKSTILRCIACQFIHHGAHAFVLDYKRISHPWARGVPGVTYCRDIAEIHDALIYLGHEGRRRIRLAEQLGDDVLDNEPERVGPRLVILLEEVNATMKQLAHYWSKIREKGDPKTSPAIDALAEILFMGRQVRLHVLLVAQSATARALGGPEMRENFSTRILVRYTLNAWRMLVPEVTPAPKPTTHPGRVQVVLGGTAHETQVLNLTDDQARQWAMSGAHTSEKTIPHKPPTALTTPQPAPTGDTAPGFPETAPQAADALPTQQTNPALPAPAASDDDLIGLRQAQKKHLPDLTLAALRWARANDPDFPAPAGKSGAELLYRVSDLERWARNRPRAAAGSTDAA